MAGEAQGSSSNNSICDCNICFEVAVIPVVTKCGHMFCSGCLFRWLDSGCERHPRNCPVCKGTLRKETDVIRIYGGARHIGEPALQEALEVPVQHDEDVGVQDCPVHGELIARSGAARDVHEDHPLTPRRSLEILRGYMISAGERSAFQPPTQRRRTATPTHEPDDEGVICIHPSLSLSQGLSTRQARVIRVSTLTNVPQVTASTSWSVVADPSAWEQEATSQEPRGE